MTRVLIALSVTLVAAFSRASTVRLHDQRAFYSVRMIDASRGWVSGIDKLYLTADGGSTWRKISAMELNDARGSRFGPSPPGEIVFGDSEGVLVTSHQGFFLLRPDTQGVIKSDIPAFVRENFIDLTLINRKTGVALLRGSNGYYLFRTNDFGKSWSSLRFPNQRIHISSVCPRSWDEVWMVGELGSVFHTVDSDL